MLPGLSENESLHNLTARNKVRFPKAFFYGSRLCLSEGMLTDPSAYASGSPQKTSEVEILRVLFRAACEFWVTWFEHAHSEIV